MGYYLEKNMEKGKDFSGRIFKLPVLKIKGRDFAHFLYGIIWMIVYCIDV